MLPFMTPEALLQTINARHGTAFALGGRFAAGEQGAFAIVDPEGKRFVLKWRSAAPVAPFLPAREMTERLYARGYPLPRYTCDGSVDGQSYAIQQMLPGVPMGRLESRYISRLLELNDLQACIAPSSVRGWREMLVLSVLRGFDEYCVIASLRDYSSSTADLLAHVQALVTANADVILPTNDIVHFDFNLSNILVEDGQISGVVDWDAPCAGDRSFDLATLLFYADDGPELRATLAQHVLDRSSREALQLYLAHMIVRQLDWSIRHHERAVVEHWLGVSQLIARELLDFR
ncbi:MAG TPA: aminoglycoside phosphotransferase family protein [Nitrolancea sp.]|nr:aminoglycoside phosphotransferase family protein [Nitrolancea sp.]